MSKNLNAPEIPLCTNIVRLQSYLLAPDEVILFDWFIVKQIAFRYKDFHYSQLRIEEETRIKRTRQDTIIKRFVEWGFLKLEIRINAATRGRVTFFKVDFGTLSNPNILSRMINSHQPLFKDYLHFIQHHVNTQSQDVEVLKEETADKNDVNQMYDLLNDIYDQRRIMYNEGKLTEEEPERQKPATQLPRNKAINKKILHLAATYNRKTIQGAFSAYVDAVLTEDESPNRILNHFLSYNETKGSFGIVEYYINYSIKHYSTVRPDEFYY